MTDNNSEVAPTSEQRDAAGVGELDNSPGSQLMRAREQAGLTRKALSDRLCMIGNKLELLETDQYDRLPSPLYVRGYIRSACKELKVDPQPVLNAYSGYCTAEEESREIVAHISRGPDLTVRRSGRRWLALLPLLVVGGVFWWMQGRDAIPPALMENLPKFDVIQAESARSAAAQEPSSPAADGSASTASADVASDEASVQAAPATPAQPAPAAQASAEPAAPVAAQTSPLPESGHKAPEESVTAGEPQRGAADQVAARQPASAANTEAAQVAETAETAKPPAGPAAELQLSFDEESWVEVRDASGSVLIASLKPAGSRVTVSGQPPFSLMLGNARATQVRYQGQLIDSAPIGNRRTRRLTVGE